MAKLTAAENTARLEQIGLDRLKGRRIVDVRYMTPEESAAVGFEGGRAIILQLDNDAMIYPSQDDEGNDAGVLFGCHQGEEWRLPVL